MIYPMTRYDAASRCTGPDQPTFRWYGYPPCAPGSDVEAAVSVLMASVSPSGRVWNPWSERMVRSEFRSVLQRAELGELEPVDEVKPVDANNPPPLYELRWQGIATTDLDATGKQSHGEVVVRLYHSEPSEAPDYFIGHHAHEKDVDAADVWTAQNAEIATAVGWYNHGRNSNWGIATP